MESEVGKTTVKASYPELIDNRDGNTLAKALCQAIRDLNQSRSSLKEIRIATAFFSPSGFFRISESLSRAGCTRLMLGADLPSDSMSLRRKIDEDQSQFEERQLKVGFEKLEKALNDEQARMPFTRDGTRALKNLIGVLKAGNVEVRRYEKAFLHAKTYILTGTPVEELCDKPADTGVIVGSSNLTYAGLTTNLELNLARRDARVVRQAVQWFDSLWEEAEPYDLTELYEEMFQPRDPWDVFLFVLWRLYGEEMDQEPEDTGNLPLTSFQKHGVFRALRLIEKNGGVIVADEVGLGKTFIAGEILKRYLDRRQRTLLICPAALRDSTWEKFLSEYQMYAECLSYEQLSRDSQLSRQTTASGENLQRPLDEYQLIIVDEAHNYRNPDSPMRAGTLRSLLFGKQRDVLFLTATPVNNSLWDLYHLIRFFIKQDAHFADLGILSIKERFATAMRADPSDLNPDVLYPIVDATTVKRTRQFVQKHYAGDTINGPDGVPQTIVFPKPTPITVRYELDGILPGFFDEIERALAPDGSDAVTFSRYMVEDFRIDGGESEGIARGKALVGLIRSGILKRFESSARAFQKTVGKMAEQHNLFLQALDAGNILTTDFFEELSADDERAFEKLLEESENVLDASGYDVERLGELVSEDMKKLDSLARKAGQITAENDTKLRQLAHELEIIAKEAEGEAGSLEEKAQKRKVLVFSFFEDTVVWIRDYLKGLLEAEGEDFPYLKKYKGRLEVVSGSDELTETSRQNAIYGFAPVSSQAPPGKDEDRYDVLISTDVLAEGMNLQQCRHIINYDLPWNPMRLVQRHGRIDRIGSPHSEVFLRTIFPEDRLDEMLDLEKRIFDKLAMASASIGVTTTVEGAEEGRQVFSETRQEIENLMREDPALFERGGTEAAAQTSEEYRHTLRSALNENKKKVTEMPWKSGSGMIKGKQRGFFFCALGGEPDQPPHRTYLRFVKADDDWQPISEEGIVREIGTCLRLIECEKDTPVHLPESIQDAVFDFWEIAKRDVFQAWMRETDPKNIQPKVRPLNKRVAEFIRKNRPSGVEDKRIDRALDTLESPWPMREEKMLRQWFSEGPTDLKEKSKFLIGKVLATGMEPHRAPDLLPPIREDGIYLICWLAIEVEA